MPWTTPGHPSLIAFMLSPLIKASSGVIVIAVLFAGCQKTASDTATATSAASSSAASASVDSAASAVQSANAAPVSAAPRGKPDFGGVTTQHVEVTATGPTQEAAINNAIRLAIEQVNGKRIDAASFQVNTTASANNAGSGAPGFAEVVATATAGAVSHFQILTQKQVNTPKSTDDESLTASQGASWNKGSVDASATSNASLSRRAEISGHDDTAKVNARASDDLATSGAEHVNGQWDQQQGAQRIDYDKKHTDYVTVWEVRIGADVASYRPSEGAKLTRVVVAQPHTQGATYQVGDGTIAAEVIAASVQAKVAEALTQTHRFTVLDRTADAAIDAEIGRIQSGQTTPADTARLGQQLAADLIVIPTITRFEYVRHQRKLEMADRTLVSYSGGAEVAFKVVNAVTGQMVLSQSFTYDFPSTAPTTLGSGVEGTKLASAMMDSMNRSIVASILQSTYPLSVVAVEGKNVVLNQGGDAVQEGASYQAVVLGKPIIDPQSGLSLGPTEAPCCTIQIDRVSTNLSYGHVIEDGVKIPEPFVAGSMELRGKVHKSMPKEVASVASVVRAPRTAKKHVSEDDSAPKANDANW